MNIKINQPGQDVKQLFKEQTQKPIEERFPNQKFTSEAGKKGFIEFADLLLASGLTYGVVGQDGDPDKLCKDFITLLSQPWTAEKQADLEQKQREKDREEYDTTQKQPPGVHVQVNLNDKLKD